MRITVDIDVGQKPDPVAMEQFMSWAARLDTGNVMLRGTNDWSQAPVAVEENQPASTETQSAPAAATETPAPAATETPAPAAPRRGRPPGSGGRPSTKTAAQQAEAVSQPGNGADTAPAPKGFAMPPGVAIPPGIVVEQQPQQQTQPIEPAMPKAEGPAPNGADGYPTADDLRACVAQANQKDKKLAFRILHAKQWPSDSSTKDSWFMVEAVPAELRERFILEVMSALGG